MKAVTFSDQLIKYSGEDLSVIKLCERNVQSRFAFIGFFVTLIFIGCFTAALYSFYNLFEKSWVIAIPVAFFIGWMFNIIYTLLLYTLTPNLLIEKKDDRFTRFALYVRLVFIAIIALIMARPLSVFIFNSIVARETALHRKELYNFQAVQTDSVMIEKEMELKKDLIISVMLSKRALTVPGKDLVNKIHQKIGEDSIFLVSAGIISDKIRVLKKYSYINRFRIDSLHSFLFMLAKEESKSDSDFIAILETLKNSGEYDTGEAGPVASEMENILRAKLQHESRLEAVLNKSSFFIHKIQVLSFKYPYTWIVDLFIVVIFLLPIYWKYKGRQFNEYFLKRKYIERKIVAEEYGRFKETFSHLLAKKAGKPVSYYEPYTDPPFNTSKKTDPDNYKKQDDFLGRIYGNE
jgi:ABC-type multidrug transport system fused ATPase/permease subunit